MVNVCFTVPTLRMGGLWSKRQQVKTVTGQNSDTERATGMAIFKAVTNPNNT